MSVLDKVTADRDDWMVQSNDHSPATVLWISAHPEPCSLTGNLRCDGIDRLRQNGHMVIESDLYALDWDPVVRPRDGGHHTENKQSPFAVSADTRSAYIAKAQPNDIAREQEKLRRAAAVIVQFPLWWYSMPAILKGWFDRVFVSGFAFGSDPVTGRRLRFEQGPFVGKRALVVTTLGDRPQAIGPRGKSGELSELLFGLLHGTFAYTGMSVLPPVVFASADRLTDYEQTRDELFHRLDGLFVDREIPYRPQFTGDYTTDWELDPRLRPGEHGVRIHTES